MPLRGAIYSRSCFAVAKAKGKFFSSLFLYFKLLHFVIIPSVVYGRFAAFRINDLENVLIRPMQFMAGFWCFYHFFVSFDSPSNVLCSFQNRHNKRTRKFSLSWIVCGMQCGSFIGCNYSNCFSFFSLSYCFSTSNSIHFISTWFCMYAFDTSVLYAGLCVVYLFNTSQFVF